MHAGCVPPPPGLGLSARYILSRSASVRLPVLITHVEYMGGNLAFEIRKVRTHVLRRQVGLSVPSHSKSYIKVRNCLPTCPTATLVAWRIGISSSRKYASDQITRWSKSSTFGEFSSLLTVRTLTGMTTDVYPRENCLAVVARAQHLDGFKGVVDGFKLLGIAGHPIGTIKRNVPGSKHVNNTKVARRKVATHRVPWPPAGAAALLG